MKAGNPVAKALFAIAIAAALAGCSDFSAGNNGESRKPDRVTAESMRLEFRYERIAAPEGNNAKIQLTVVEVEGEVLHEDLRIYGSDCEWPYFATSDDNDALGDRRGPVGLGEVLECNEWRTTVYHNVTKEVFWTDCDGCGVY